jgi:hypothetical protein
MDKTPNAKVTPPPVVKSHGQIYYECSGSRLTAWEKLSKVSQLAYASMAQRYDNIIEGK